jgi:hypothetical protein
MSRYNIISIEKQNAEESYYNPPWKELFQSKIILDMCPSLLPLKQAS